MPKPVGFQFRSAKKSEIDQFRRIANYVFASPPTGEEQPSRLDPEWSHCAFKSGKMAAISGAYPFSVQLNGNSADVHGVTAVGTEPESRRLGLVRRLITDLLHRGKQQGQVASMLLASMGAIYQRFGYGLASRAMSYEFDPREAEFQLPFDVQGCVRRLNKADAMPLVKKIFKAYAKSRNLLALRPDPVWEDYLSGVEKDRAYCAVHYDDKDKPDGYCIYTTRWSQQREAGPPQDMNISDLAYTSMNGYRGIWQYIRSHDLVGRVIWGNVPEDDPAFGILLEPRCLHAKLVDRLWFRIIDVPAVLEARHYDADGDLTIKVEGDGLCKWNNGSFALSVRDGKGTVKPTKRARTDIVCSINGLASLVTGFSDLAQLDRIGRLQVRNPARLKDSYHLFSTRYRPSLSFWF